MYRRIDFKRLKDGVPGRVVSIEYDPNRTTRIALIFYADGEKAYILAPLALSVDDWVESGTQAEIHPGNCLPLRAIPTGHNICAILDAKKKEVYTASFREVDGTLKRLTPDRAVTPDQLCQEIEEPTVFIGNGLDSYGDLLASRLGNNFLPAQNNLLYTVAACAARLAENHFDQEKLFDLDKLNIKYVRKSEAELNLAGTE